MYRRTLKIVFILAVIQCEFTLAMQPLKLQEEVRFDAKKEYSGYGIVTYVNPRIKVSMPSGEEARYGFTGAGADDLFCKKMGHPGGTFGSHSSWGSGYSMELKSDSEYVMWENTDIRDFIHCKEKSTVKLNFAAKEFKDISPHLAEIVEPKLSVGQWSMADLSYHQKKHFGLEHFDDRSNFKMDISYPIAAGNSKLDPNRVIFLDQLCSFFGFKSLYSAAKSSYEDPSILSVDEDYRQPFDKINYVYARQLIKSVVCLKFPASHLKR